MVVINAARARQYLKAFEFKKLFVEELLWDRPAPDLPVAVNGQTFKLKGLAEKHGFQILACPPGADGRIPDYALRGKIERQVTKSAREHLIVYVDTAKTTQVWQWVRRELGKPLARREHHFSVTQSGDALIQKLQALGFSFEQEEGLTIFEVVGSVVAAFNVEPVTRRFYDRFKTEHTAFRKFLSGIPDERLQDWYVSVMLNRLMFIYFIQRKGFLNDDADYLRTQLGKSQQRGKDRYYRDVLCPLFFEGFAKPRDERSAEVNRLLGRVPYLNGGLFLKHQIEELHGRTIAIPDTVFNRLFKFFDEYQWHLDERPLREGNEINPDVLGYIFEKYINQRQMGAYYTKEDITGYISQNTIVPFLFDRAREDCRVAFDGAHSVWDLLPLDPDRYIYDAVKKGVDQPLPRAIAAGIRDVSKRTDWNKSAPDELALPTETWREVVARRQRHDEVRGKLQRGEVRDINDFITYNLNLRQFAQDVIENAEGPELLRAFWKALTTVSVLDPTVGSGAFLFAALNILESLYEACLERMAAFVDELDRSGERHSPRKFEDFRAVLKQIDEHPNRRYFIFKSIIINNLFGVDIMAEAVEICKLRLFLKLVAQVEPDASKENLGVEPLPDIDFNIRAGNTLVGFATLDEVQRAIQFAEAGQGVQQAKMMFADDQATLHRIEEQAQLADRAFSQFRAMQTKRGMAHRDFEDAKAELRKRLDKLNDELNGYLATEYGVNVKKKQDYKAWLESHQPFHWFVEFYGVLKSGGFDVIIGNPPYVEYSKIRNEYKLLPEFDPYATNLYSACCYRSGRIKHINGWASFIVPVSLPSTDRMQPLRDLLTVGHDVHFVGFSTRPSKLFDGAEQRLTIYLQSPSSKQRLFAGGYLKWNLNERRHIFECIEYVETTPINARHNIWPKIRGQTHRAVFDRIQSKPALTQIQVLGTGKQLYYKNTGIRYFSTVTLRAPRCWINGVATSSSRETTLDVLTKYRHYAHVLLLSTTFFI